MVHSHHTRLHGVKFQSVVLPMAWLSTLKEYGDAEDMTAYYALWIGSTKSTPVADMV